MSQSVLCSHCSFSLTDTSRTACPVCGHAIAPTANASSDWWVAPMPAPAVPTLKPPPLPVPPELSQPTAPRALPVVGIAIFGGLFFVVAATVAVLALPKRDRSSRPVAESTASATVQIESEPIPQRPVEVPATVPQPRHIVGSAPASNLLPAPLIEESPLPAPPPVAVVEQPKPVPKVEAEPGKLVVKRRVERDEAVLVAQLAKVPELRLDRSNLRNESKQMLALGRKARQAGLAEDTGVAAMEKRIDLAGLPWLKGDACKISASAASNLQDGSLALRDFLSGVVNGGRPAVAPTQPDPKHVHDQLNKNGRDHNRWLKAEAIPALQQLLMAEDDSIREVLVDQLARIKGKRASVALAQRALYDLHPRVRARALEALQKRPGDEYRDTLLTGFAHPWPVVAEHAGEALVALKLKETVPSVLALLDVPSPNLPYKDEKKGVVVKEMVRVNHLANCLLCHAPATKQDDRVRGRVPDATRPLPPAFSRQYYADTSGTFVRAEVTYLRQDFSVPLPVPNHSVWPEVQRFDFLVRERPALPSDLVAAKKLKEKGATAHHQAMFFVLRELTGADPGPTADDWKKHFLKRDLNVSAVVTGLKNARGLAVAEGVLYIADGSILKREGDARPSAWVADAAGIEALTVDGKGNLLALNGKSGQLVRFDSSGESKTVASKFDGRRFVHPRRLAADRHGGVYLSDEVGVDATRDRGGVYYVSSQGSVTHLSLSTARPRAVALSPDGKRLYVAAVSGGELVAHEVESAGNVGKGKKVANVGSGVTDLTVDLSGNVVALESAAQSVVVLAPSGVRLGLARLPEAPVACCVWNRSLYVLTKKAVYHIDLGRATESLTAKR